MQHNTHKVRDCGVIVIGLFHIVQNQTENFRVK